MKHNVDGNKKVENIEKAVVIIDSVAVSFSSDGAYTSDYSSMEANVISSPNPFYREQFAVIIGVKSRRTGKIAYYYRVNAEYNQDNELLYEKYIPTTDTAKMMPQLQDTTLTVFND